MTVRVEQVQTGEEHLAIFFIDASFRDLYPQQRYHKLTSVIPRLSQMITSRFSYPLICDVPFGGWLALPSQWIRLRVSAVL